MPCRPQSNPRSTSSDGVPPELEVLGLHGVLCRTGLTGRHNWSDRSMRREPVGEDRVDNPRVLAHSSVLALISVNTLFGDSAGDRLIWLFKSDLIYSLEKMGVITDLDKGNISTSIEELSEEARQDYLVVRGHFKAQFLKGFRKKSARTGHEGSRLRDALLHAQE